MESGIQMIGGELDRQREACAVEVSKSELYPRGEIAVAAACLLLKYAGEHGCLPPHERTRLRAAASNLFPWNHSKMANPRGPGWFLEVAGALTAVELEKLARLRPGADAGTTPGQAQGAHEDSEIGGNAG